MFKKLFKGLVKKTKQQEVQYERCKPWFAVKGDETLRLDYNLKESSIVFDLGGYKGEFAEKIYNKYKSTIYVFEPVSKFYNIIVDKFKGQNKIKVYGFGLSNEDKELNISMTDDASSVFIKTGASEAIKLKSIVNFIEQENIEKVSLIKINIEGGEYEVLESLLKSNSISKFENIQIQFHDFIIENARERMENIQKQISKTHKVTYQYDFVWENWELKNIK